MVPGIEQPDTVGHHVLNAAAIIAPMASVMAGLPIILTVVTGFLAAIWYIILIGGKISEMVDKRRQRREMRREITR